MIKRFFVFLCFLGCIAFLAPQTSLVTYAASFPQAEFSFYVNHLPRDIPASAKVIKNGNGYIVSTSAQHAASLQRMLPPAEGQSITFSGNIGNMESILSRLNATVVSRQDIGGEIVNCYAYSSGFNKSVLVDGQKINLQVAVRNGTVTLGTPLILGSF
ncbi:MAG: YwmB family TATA-box binding protein [Firmicutes bacterium]|nr:YwmB family TATA-box binding protein [Bacillota bacterium]